MVTSVWTGIIGFIVVLFLINFYYSLDFNQKKYCDLTLEFEEETYSSDCHPVCVNKCREEGFYEEYSASGRFEYETQEDIYNKSKLKTCSCWCSGCREE